jgi:hypothetical protein
MNQIVKSAADALTIGETFHKSGMFSDIKSAQQAVVKIMAGAEMGISPFAAMSGIHIIQGKPTIGAGLMAARVKGFGKYDYKVIEHSDKVCSIEYFEKLPANGLRSLGMSTFTIDDAKKAGTKNIDRFPKNMLFARAMSNGVKWFTPDIYESPVYVPEEMESVTEETTAEVIETPTPTKRSLTPEQFEKLVAGIEAGQMAAGSDLSLYDWAIENVEMTDGQRLQIDVANAPKKIVNDQNFIL